MTDNNPDTILTLQMLLRGREYPESLLGQEHDEIQEALALDKRIVPISSPDPLRWTSNMEGTYTVYGATKDVIFITYPERLWADIQEIKGICTGYQRSSSTPFLGPVLQAREAGSTRLDVQAQDGETMGGGGGRFFLDRENAMLQLRQLDTVGLNTGKRIDQIRLCYHQETIRNIDERINENHGGSGDNGRGDIEIDKGVSVMPIQAQAWIPNRRRSHAELDCLTPLVASFGPLGLGEGAGEEDP